MAAPRLRDSLFRLSAGNDGFRPKEVSGDPRHIECDHKNKTCAIGPDYLTELLSLVCLVGMRRMSIIRRGCDLCAELQQESYDYFSAETSMFLPPSQISELGPGIPVIVYITLRCDAGNCYLFVDR